MTCCVLYAGLVQLANEILSQIHVGTRVRHVEEISPGIFVLMFEGLCGEILPGKQCFKLDIYIYML